jgi:hypothetical protein
MPYALRFADGSLYAGFSNGDVLASDDRGESWDSVPLAGERLGRIVALAALD